MLYSIVTTFFWFFFTVFYGITVVGRKNIPAGGKVLVVSNHMSHLDPPVASVAIPRHMHYFAKKELFENKWFAKLIRALNAHPVARGEGDIRAIRDSIAIINAGHPLLVFPQGHRCGEWEKAGNGAALLAKKSGALVLPLCIRGTDKAFPPKAKMLKFFTKIRVSIGEPLVLGEGESLDDFTKRMAAAIESQLPV
jgi:1-acyl-sn-glycerol-3-phosphate acyltransferase